jgi:hypothetical protein
MNKYRNEAIVCFTAAIVICAAWLYYSAFITEHIWACTGVAGVVMAVALVIAAMLTKARLDRDRYRNWYLED